MDNLGVLAKAITKVNVFIWPLVHLIKDLAEQDINHLGSQHLISRNAGEVSGKMVTKIAKYRSQGLSSEQILPLVAANVLNSLTPPRKDRNLLKENLTIAVSLTQIQVLISVEPSTEIGMAHRQIEFELAATLRPVSFLALNNDADSLVVPAFVLEDSDINREALFFI